MNYSNIHDIISPRYPRLIEAVKDIIEEAEKAFNENNYPGIESSSLWDHTLQVASMASSIALKEEIDVFIPVVVGLFHDTGKFYQGQYHITDIPEEQHSRMIAKEVLRQHGMPHDEIQAVADALNALYNDTGAGPQASRIVHDAEFLTKLGHTGIARFFVKQALRKRNLDEIIRLALSKELTYAHNAAFTMLTSSGRNMARTKADYTIGYFENLLTELCELQTACFRIERVKVPCTCQKSRSEPVSMIDIVLVIPEGCNECGGEITYAFSRKPDIKCECLVADMHCTCCDMCYSLSFCLPEISRT